MLKTEPTLTVHCDYSVSPSALWMAITNLEEMKQWYFHNIPNFQAELGFKTEFTVQSSNLTFTHQWEVKEVIKNQKLSYGWKYKEYDGDSIIHFIIEPLESGCRLTVSCEILEDFPQDIPEFKMESGRAGWSYFLKDRLTNYLAEK